MSVEEIEKQYCESLFVKNMIEREFLGNCKSCEKKYSCGGCRARALYFNSNYLANDPYCWLNN